MLLVFLTAMFFWCEGDGRVMDFSELSNALYQLSVGSVQSCHLIYSPQSGKYFSFLKKSFSLSSSSGLFDVWVGGEKQVQAICT